MKLKLLSLASLFLISVSGAMAGSKEVSKAANDYAKALERISTSELRTSCMTDSRLFRLFSDDCSEYVELFYDTVVKQNAAVSQAIEISRGEFSQEKKDLFNSPERSQLFFAERSFLQAEMEINYVLYDLNSQEAHANLARSEMFMASEDGDSLTIVKKLDLIQAGILKTLTKSKGLVFEARKLL